MARTFALIALVPYVLHQVSCSYETIPNALKYYETYRNITCGSNWVDWVRSLRKIRTWLHGTNFCINCTSSHRFEPSFMQFRNDNRWTQTLWNIPKHEFRVKWGWSGAFFVYNSDMSLWNELLHSLLQFSPFCTEFTAVTKQSQMHPNTMKHAKTRVLGPMGRIGCVHCE